MSSLLRVSALARSRTAGTGRQCFSSARAKRPAKDLSRRTRWTVSNALILEPTGDGSCEHLEGKFSVPGPIELTTVGTIEVGRAPPADVILGVPTVSTRHALIKFDGSQVAVTDLGSTNGTYIDGETMDSMVAYPLPIGSEVVFGDEFLCRFVLLDDENLKTEDSAAVVVDVEILP